MAGAKKNEVKLTPKQAAFVSEYLVDLNASQAAIRAGYSQRNAGKIGFQLLEKNRVQVAIQQAIKRREQRTEITQDRVLQELAKIGFANIKDFVSFRTAKTVVDHDENGEPINDYAHIIDLKDSDAVDGAIISEVQLKDGVLKFKLYDKEKALEMIGKHLGMFGKSEAPPPPAVNVQTNITTIVQDLTPAERQKAILNASNRLRQERLPTQEREDCLAGLQAGGGNTDGDDHTGR